MEYHLFIIWHNALYIQKEIISDIKQHLDIVQIIEGQWDAATTPSNFSRFYGTNLPPHSFKEKECGSGTFKIIIVKDNAPHYEIRKTSKGDLIVNTNIFDLKEKYRKWTNGGSKIHGTNTPKEFQHDLTLLLGLCPNDYFEKYGAITERTINQNIVGHNGWKSIKQLFYVLNNTVNYVILRGGELLIDAHNPIFTNGDIDILTDDYDNAVYIINGTPACSITRPHQKIEIEKKQFFLDLWDYGRAYYDFRWENQMLLTRTEQNGAYTLNKINDFYTLLYHCLINKNHIEDKYISKLNSYKTTHQLTHLSWEQILINFLSANDFDITTPKDTSVGCNTSNKLIHDYAYRNGKLIQSHFIKEYNLFSRIYQKEGLYIKQGSQPLINNEKYYLQMLEAHSQFPKVIDDSNGTITISNVPGTTLQSLLDSKYQLSLQQQKMFLLSIINILEILYSKRIIHRDFTPSNILIDIANNNCKVGLIDFGWAIQYGEEKSAITPNGLGEIYRHPTFFSDAYAFAQILKTHFSNSSYLTSFAHYFEEIASKQHPATSDLIKIRKKVSKNISILKIIHIQMSNGIHSLKEYCEKAWRKAIYPLHFRQWIRKIRPHQQKLS